MAPKDFCSFLTHAKEGESEERAEILVQVDFITISLQIGL